MGTLTLSGVLKRPISGDVVPNARITFDAIATGNVVLKGVSSACKTASDGSYSVDLEYGSYAIQVSWAGQTQQYGTVNIDDTTPIGSLNDLLMQELTESQLTPEIVLEFRQLEQEMQEDLAQMEGLNDQASGSASSAAASANAAATSETNSAASEDASAASAAAAAKSETNSAASDDASAASATAAKTSETNSAASEEASANSEINAKNARDAAEEYALEAKDAASKVTNPLTDQGQWAIQTGYPKTPEVASIWQITDGGVDPVNSEIIWDAGDMLVYLAATGTWCRLLGQQTVAGEPVPLKIDADIILNVGSGLQIVTSGTTAVDVARLDTDNNLVLGADALPGICLKAAEPTNLFVLVSDGNGGYTKSRIYTESFPPPAVTPPVTSVNGETGDVELTAEDVSALPISGGEIDGNLSVIGALDISGGSTFREAIYRTRNSSITTYDGDNIIPYSTKTVWCRIMQLYMPQSASTAVLKIYGGEGFNGLPTNNDIQTIVLRTGNASVAVNENGRIGVSLYKTSGDGIGAISNVHVVESSDSTYDVYAQINAYTANGFGELLVSSSVKNVLFPRELYGDDGTVAPDTNMTTTIYHTGYWSDDNPTMTVQDLYANGDGRFTNINAANNISTPNLSVGRMDGGCSLVMGDSDTGFGNGGDGILLMFANAVNVMTAQSSVVEFHIPLATDGTLEGWGGVFDDGQRVYSPINPPPASSTTSAALGTNGWWKDNSTGMIIQFGTTANVNSEVFFPIAFPTLCTSVTIGNISSSRIDYPVVIAGIYNNGFFMNREDASETSWIAIGY